VDVCILAARHRKQSENILKDLFAKIVEWALVGGLGYLIAVLMEWRKKIRFVVSDWKLQYFHMDSLGGWHYDENPPEDGKEIALGVNPIRYSFTLRIFNEKSKPVGLHRFLIQFSKGPWNKRQFLIQTDDLRHGPGRTQSGRVQFDSFSEMQLPSHEWAVEDVVGYLDFKPGLKEVDSVWFVAYSASGYRYRWRVARLNLRRD
jgi:hypothetical protein